MFHISLSFSSSHTGGWNDDTMFFALPCIILSLDSLGADTCSRRIRERESGVATPSRSPICHQLVSKVRNLFRYICYHPKGKSICGSHSEMFGNIQYDLQGKSNLCVGESFCCCLLVHQQHLHSERTTSQTL